MMSPESPSFRVIQRLTRFLTTVSLATAPAEWRDLSSRQIKATVESEVLDFSPNISDLAYFPYPRLFVYVWTVLLDLEDETGSCAALQSQWSKWIASDQVAQIESSISIKYALQAFLEPHRPIVVDSLVQDIIKLDMQNVVATVLILLSDRETRRSLLERPKHQSQDLLDVLQELLDFLPLRDVRPQVLLATYELSKRTRLYPKSLRLSRVEALQQSEDHGSFGDIWKGNFSGTLVAIKVMRQPNAKRLLKTFIGKAILWRELSHPNVLSFYGIHLWPNDGRICLVSPWMENGNLVSYLKDHSDADHLALAIDVAQGVEYLHSFDPQIIHGDLKGNNILITSDLRACVADFGLGKFIQTDALCQFTPSTTLPGTLMWCAPELVNDNRPTISLASDVYALGCVFYEIFVGKMRFAHLTKIIDRFTAVSSGTIPERPEGINDDIWGIMLDCWNLHPASRPAAKHIIEVLLPIRKRRDGTSLRVITRLADFMTTVSLANAPVEWRDLSFRQIKATVESEVLDFSPNVSDLTCFPYPRLFVYVWTVLHLEDDPRSFAALQSQWFKWIALDEVAQIESSISIKYDLQAFLTPHRQIFVDGLIKDIIKLDMQNVAAIIMTSLLDSETRKSLLGRPKPQSQDLLDVLQELLNSLPLHDVRPRILLATYQISKRTGLYPKSLRLSGVEALQRSGDRGTFGDIWKGNFSGTLVAIKVTQQADPELLRVLIKTHIGEAILWRELSHPNVLSFHGIHLWPDGRICLVSPWMENGNLVRYLKDHLNADRLALALDVAQGLGYLHSFNPPIIHGNLKGNNILITSNLRACVADFGLGKIIHSNIHSDPFDIFELSYAPGLLMSCAPELVIEDRPIISLASDVYALGCVFYEIFAGEVRFAHLTEILHLVTAISSGTIPERPEGIDDSIWGIMLHCWELKPMSRPTARRIVEMLQTIRKRHSGRKSPSPRPMLTPIIHENILINTHPAQTVPSSDSETISTSDIEESSTLTLKETAVVEPVVIPAVATERADKITEDLAFEAAIPELAALVELTTEAEAEAIADTTDSSLGEADSEDKTLKIHSIRSPLEQVETEMSLSIDHAMSIPTWLRVAKSHRSFKVLQGLKFDKFKDRLMKDPRNDDIVIPIMGPTGTGRSSFINILMGNDAMKVGHELQSCTAQLDYTILHSSKYPQLGVQGHHRIVILDTPGFDDTFETDYEILRRISVWLTHSYSEGMRLAGVVYLHDISQTRMLGSTRKNFELFRKLCGLKASPHIVLTTTKWGRVSRDEGERRETQLVDQFWDGIILQKAKTCRFARTQESALDIIKQVISSADLAVEGADHSLSIQKELVVMQKRLAETDSGSNLRSSLKEALESAKAMESRLKEGAAANAPPQLKKEYKESRKQIETLLWQIEDLKIPISRQIKGLFAFH